MLIVLYYWTLVTSVLHHCCHICIRESRKKVSYWKKKLKSMWEGKRLSHRLKAEVVQCVTKLLCPAWNMRSFWKRGEGEAIITLAQLNFRLKNVSIYPQSILCLTVSWAQSNLRLNSNALLAEKTFSSTPFPFQAGNTGEKFNDLSLSGNQLIFIQGGEEWVECIDVWKQTTALCAWEAWYEKERTLR